MTNPDYTALVLVVDRSGSMSPIAKDLEGGIESLLAEQRALPGKLTVDYVRFDDEIEYIFKLADPAKVRISISPRNTTALNDAVGSTIMKFGLTLAALPEDERPAKVLFVIATDGLENASREFTGPQVKELIQQQTDEYQWEFVYLGANQDAVAVAQGMGIAADAALTYNTANVGAMAASLNSYVTGTRSAGSASFTDADRKANAVTTP